MPPRKKAKAKVSEEPTKTPEPQKTEPVQEKKPEIQEEPTKTEEPTYREKTEEVRESRLRQGPVTSKKQTTLPEFDPKYQRLFEAPDGAIVVGDKNATFALYRIPGTNNTLKINPMRRPISADERSRQTFQREQDKSKNF